MKINCKLKAQASEITIAVTIIVEVAANNWNFRVLKPKEQWFIISITITVDWSENVEAQVAAFAGLTFIKFVLVEGF
jgi:hypothetical protein